MARKRQIDPDFFTDEEIAEFEFQARLFYIGTWIHCEDTGVFEVKHRTLKGKIFPFDEGDTQGLYVPIRDKGKFIEYTAGGRIFSFIKGFHKHQKIQYPSRSFLPLPPEPYLSYIPAKISKLNESSLSALSVLSEESKRVELSREELVELSREEEATLKKIYTSPLALKKHLTNRRVSEKTIDQVVKRMFGDKDEKK